MITYLTTAHYEHNFLYMYMYGQMAEPTIIDGVVFSLSLAKTTLYPNQYVRCSIKAALYLEVVVCVMLW